MWRETPDTQLNCFCRASEQAHPLSVAGWDYAHQTGIIEVVEVKNRSPFRRMYESQLFSIADSGPATEVRTNSRRTANAF